MTPRLIGIKYPKQIPLCDTNTVILITIVITIDTVSKQIPLCDTNTVILITIGITINTVSTYLPKKISEITNQKKSMWQVGEILRLWGEKAITGIAIFLITM